ncbi:unnamed protein product, partial [Didymodactylos carnosus]
MVQIQEPASTVIKLVIFHETVASQK